MHATHHQTIHDKLTKWFSRLHLSILYNVNYVIIMVEVHLLPL